MTEDQYQRMQKVHEKLVDVLLMEADPDNWPGAGLHPNDMSRETRGDQYWHKKTTAGTAALVNRIGSLIVEERRRALALPVGARAEEEEVDLDREVERYERRAAKMLDAALARAKAR